LKLDIKIINIKSLITIIITNFSLTKFLEDSERDIYSGYSFRFRFLFLFTKMYLDAVIIVYRSIDRSGDDRLDRSK